MYQLTSTTKGNTSLDIFIQLYHDVESIYENEDDHESENVDVCDKIRTYQDGFRSITYLFYLIIFCLKEMKK